LLRPVELLRFGGAAPGMTAKSASPDGEMGKRGPGTPVPGIKVSSVGKMMNDEGDVAFAASSADLVQYAG